MVLISIRSGDEDKRKERKMALLGLQPPPAFLECPGEPKVTFDAWKKLFDNYLLAIGGKDYSAERKRALLIHCLGTEEQRSPKHAILAPWKGKCCVIK